MLLKYWYTTLIDYMIPKWRKNNVKLIYKDTGSLAPLLKIDDFYEDIKDDVEERYDTLN